LFKGQARIIWKLWHLMCIIYKKLQRTRGCYHMSYSLFFFRSINKIILHTCMTKALSRTQASRCP
jgi:hypothetical protein